MMPLTAVLSSNGAGIIDPALVWDIPAPRGYHRTSLPPDSFGAWLRRLPLKPPGSPVRLHDGRRKANQSAHHSVIDLPIGRRDLHQCADAVIRLRAEFLYDAGRTHEICFSITSGPILSFAKWAEGLRPIVEHSRIRWVRRAGRDLSRRSLESFLETAYCWCGTISLARDLVPAETGRLMAISYVLVQGGSPGHAVIAVDEADGPDGVVVLLAQSFMPAQELHILVNPNEPSLSPWYRIPEQGPLVTPEWIFREVKPMRFPDGRRCGK